MKQKLDAFFQKFSIPKNAQQELDRILSSSTDVDEITDTFHRPQNEADLPNATERYQIREKLGSGAVGNVFLAYDTVLQREVALKTLHENLQGDRSAVARFQEEAKWPARLQHPNIITIYDFGFLPDSTPYFTMPVIKGSVLEVYLQREDVRIRSAVEIFCALCEAVAYAHDHGIQHGDLKPTNIMVTTSGTPVLVDWGLAAHISNHKRQSPRPLSKIRGTPAYLSPEQAAGENNYRAKSSEIYTLGMILLRILTGTEPYQDRSVEQIIRSLRLKEEICVHDIVDQANPIYQDAEVSSLLNICQRALHIDTEQRYANVTDMRFALEEWLVREQERESARTLFQKAITLLTKAEQKRLSANEKYATVQNFRKNTDPWIVDEHRQRTQAVLDSYHLEQHRADTLSTEAVGIMRTILENTPSFEPVSQRLVVELRRQHIQAETNGDTLIASSLWQQLQTVMHHLPDEHPEKQPLHNYLQGDGCFSLHTKPEGAELVLERYIEQGLRLVPEPMGLIGESPIQKYPLPIGSFRLKIRKDGFDEVLYPVHISRNQHWDGLPPRGIGETSVYLPPKGSLQAEEVYIPAGYFLHSSTPNQRHRVKTWLSGYVIQKYPVTNQQYLLFINWLLRYESEEAALRCAPQRNGHSLYERSTDGTFVLPEKERGSCRPVVCVDYHSVQNYTVWHAKIDKKPWRLPSVLEWSKAAFGVDGRGFPWGNRSECAWANTCESSAIPQLSSIYDFATDCSPYGVCGMAGNVRDLALHALDGRSDISVCGGSWRTTLQDTYCRSTPLHHALDRFEDVGFRLVYS